MAIEREHAVSTEQAGETFWFCSKGCRAEYLGAAANAAAATPPETTQVG
jgi:YHS domain-containing protein